MGTEKHRTTDQNVIKGKHSLSWKRERICSIPHVKWTCPPKFTLDPNWCIVAGECSTEAKKLAENLGSSSSLYVADDDGGRSTPEIPLTAIEEEFEKSHATDNSAPFWTAASSKTDQCKDISKCCNFKTPNFSSSDSFMQAEVVNADLQKLPAVDGDMMAAAVAAAAAALSACSKQGDVGSLIDTDLLIKFLSNPEIVHRLINEQGVHANTGSEPASVLKERSSLVSLASSKANQVKSNINDNVLPARTGVQISGPASVLKERSSLVSLASSKANQVKSNINDNVPPARTGVRISGPKAGSTEMTPLLSFQSSKPNLEMIDTELLIQFLSNPETLHKLIKEHGIPVNTGLGSVSMQSKVVSSDPLYSFNPEIVMKSNISEHGIPAMAGIFTSGHRAMTPSASFPSSKHVLKTVNFTNEDLPPARVATVRMTSSPSLVVAATNEHGASSSKGGGVSVPKSLMSPRFPRSEIKLETVKVTDDHVLSPEIALVPMSPVLPFPGTTVIDEHNSSASTGMPISMPHILVPSVSSPEVTPMSPSLYLSSARHDPSLVKNLINDHEQQTDLESTQLAGRTPLNPLPNSEPNVFKFKRLINEYGAHDGRGIEHFPSSRLMMPTVPNSLPKFEMSEFASANLQPLANLLQSALHRSLSSEVSPTRVLGGTAPATIHGRKLIAPSVPCPAPRTDIGLLSMATRPTTNELQSTLHVKSTLTDVRPPTFLGGISPATMPGAKKMTSSGLFPFSSTDLSMTPMANQQPNTNMAHSVLHMIPLSSGFVRPPPSIGATASAENLGNHFESTKQQRDRKRETLSSKPCIFYNTPRGCRNGTNCQYLHIKSDQAAPSRVEPPSSAKRMKLDSETSGRMISGRWS